MKKKIAIILSVLILLAINQIYYLKYHQFKCDIKIKQNKTLNIYEVASALQTHSCFWLFGWVIEPNTALACFNKQFHTVNSVLAFELPENDSVLIKAKEQLLTKQKEKVVLKWKNYSSKASILLNGSTISLEENEYGVYYRYIIPLDYKPGIINIKNIPISETVFDYLENKKILSTYTWDRIQKLTKKELDFYYNK